MIAGKVLQTLEFDKMITQLQEHAVSSLGAEKCATLQPMTDLDAVLLAQQETDEAVMVYRLKGNVPIAGFFDVRAALKRAEIGGMLSPAELLEIGATLRVAKTMSKFLAELADTAVELPILLGYRNELAVVSELERAISDSLSGGGEVLDDASETLRSLRQQMHSLQGRIREKLDSIVRSSSSAKMLSDALVTVRNERLVIPVKQEYRSHFGGTIHDQSASGQTLFIEPQSVVQMNNELQGLRVKEQVEIERVLYALTNQVAEHTTELHVDAEVLGSLDFAFAKAKLSMQMKGSMPSMNAQGVVQLKKARHPLIAASVVVANDITIGNGFSTLVITGPNTGGKTVALKTLGLCTLMAMAGLQIPAMDGSVCAVFDQVFADIGDEQSIEQSLSTFSSHMVNIVSILEELGPNALVLFDELGAGTDPQEGAALAIAILDESMARGAKVAATTHYPELKAYGYNREQVMNASVEFDVETLSPTYRLLIGIPGKSNAFEISRKLGLQERVLKRAQQMIGADTETVENMIAALEASRNQAEIDRMEAAEILQKAEQRERDLQAALLQFHEEREEKLEAAHLEASRVLEKAKREADAVIREMRSMALKAGNAVKEQDLEKVRQKLNEAKPAAIKKESERIRKQTKPKVIFTPGDDVRVLSLNQKGNLVEKAGNSSWLVQIGIMKVKIAEQDLEKLAEKKPNVPQRQVATVKGKQEPSTFTLDLRGERYEEALLRVEKFIDDAMLAGYPLVSIIHGHGTGALRQGVRTYLQGHRGVKSIRFGGQGEGGLGVTIAELK